MTSASVESAFEHCARITARSGSNFYLAFLPMSAERRDGIFSVYAFCRVVDDIVDEPEPGTDPRRDLDQWRVRVGRLASGDLAGDPDPVARALAATHRRFGLREDDLLAVIDGVETDLVRQRHATRADLDLYCERVAGRVGCLCLPVFGAGEEARPYALTLGRAFQLTNILRDVPKDAEAGRLYLPQDAIAEHGATEADILAGRLTPQVASLLRSLSADALALFDEAEARLVPAQRPVLFPALIMAAIYRRVLEELRARDHDAWSGRVSLPRSVKGLLALGVLARDKVLLAW